MSMFAIKQYSLPENFRWKKPDRRENKKARKLLRQSSGADMRLMISFDSTSISYDGITRIRFYGYNLSLCQRGISTPEFFFCCKVNKFFSFFHYLDR